MHKCCTSIIKTSILLALGTILLSGSVFAQSESDPVYESDEVVVTASRYDESNRLNVTNITNEELQNREPDLALPLLLQSIPGTFSYSDAGNGMGYTYLKIRGFDQRRVGVLLNGIPMNDPEDHQVWWVNMPDMASSVQDIQVQRGITNSVGGMTAIGGTVNILSAGLSDQEQGKISVNTGSYGTSRQMMSYQTGELKGGFKSLLRLSRQNTDGYRDRSEYDGWAVFWSGQYETENSTTRMNIYTGREITHHAWDAVPESVLENNRTANAETYHNAVDNFSQPHYELHHQLFLSDNISLTNRLYYIQGEGYYENFKELALVSEYSLDHFLGLESDDKVDLIRRKYVRKDHVGMVPDLTWEQDRGRLLVGGDWYTFHSSHWGNILWADGFAPGRFNDEMKFHQYTGDKDAWSLYASERYEIIDGLTVTGDLHYQHKKYRFEQREAGNFTGDQLNAYTVKYDFFNPKGAITWQVPGRVAGGQMQAYGSMGINHREPADGELFDTWDSASDFGATPLFREERNVHDAAGNLVLVEWDNPYVQPEKVIDYEAGFSWQNPSLSFTLGGYIMDFENEIVAYGGVSDDGSSIRGNAEKTLHRGIELGLTAKINKYNSLSVAASRSWDEFETFIFHSWDGSIFDYSGNPISLFPQHLLMVSWESNWFDVARSRVRVRNTGKQYLDNTGEDTHIIADWTTLDLSLWLDLGAAGLSAFDGATAFVHVRNIGDTEYEVWGYYNEENFYTPAAGRNYVIGLDYSF